MNFIGKHIPLIGILLLTVFIGGAAGLYFDVPARFQKAGGQRDAASRHFCPMHTDVVGDEAGDSAKCGMTQASVPEDKPAGAGCGAAPSGCCASEVARQLKLPPGHPPIHGWQTAPPEASEPTPAGTPGHSSH